MCGQVSLGPLAAFVAGYERWLVQRGYRPGALVDRRSQFRSLSCWLAAEGLSAAELDGQRAKQFLAARRAAGRVTWVAPSSLRLPLEYLAEVGVVPAPITPRTSGVVDRLLDDYQRYLRFERSLAQTTIDGYECVARVFLQDLERRRGSVDLDRLTAADVSEFVALECRRLTDGAARGQVAKLRPFLVYLHVSGRIDTPLRWAVPKVADMRGRAMPRALEPEAVVRLLASCDRRRAVGCRDYAIVLLLVRLGLRSVEVAAMQLDDIDWRAGEILVRGKGGRHDRLPLPIDVGEAVAGYLQRRPPGESRAVFLGTLPPGGPLSRKSVGAIVSAACARAGIPRAGAHRLRHTAATRMLRAGCSLAEIGQVLRHEQLRTTAMYAKVDYAALRTLALPWPEGGAA
jgi:integrase/recombinase XerD